MLILFGILPVLLFLAFLFLLDSFKLVVKKLLVFSIIWGVVAATISYFINTISVGINVVDYETFSRYFAPNALAFPGAQIDEIKAYNYIKTMWSAGYAQKMVAGQNGTGQWMFSVKLLGN